MKSIFGFYFSAFVYGIASHYMKFEFIVAVKMSLLGIYFLSLCELVGKYQQSRKMYYNNKF
jgi:hypothetical protein